MTPEKPETKLVTNTLMIPINPDEGKNSLPAVVFVPDGEIYLAVGSRPSEEGDAVPILDVLPLESYHQSLAFRAACVVGALCKIREECGKKEVNPFDIAVITASVTCLLLRGFEHASAKVGLPLGVANELANVIANSQTEEEALLKAEEFVTKARASHPEKN